MKLVLSVFILIIMSTNCSFKNHPANPALIFTSKKIGELPPSVLTEKNKGVAGAFSGIVHDKLIVAGGTYFPDKKPWEGGIKIYEDKIYAFALRKDTVLSVPVAAKLPEPVAYGASITLPDGILCIGGNGPVKCTSKVFLIKWNEQTGNPDIELYPELPVPLSYSTATLLNNVIYLTGGSAAADGKETNNYFFRLDLSLRDKSEFAWEKLPPYPGIARILSVSAAQSNGTRDCLYLFSGRNVSNPEKPVVLKDGLVYDPVAQKWEQVQADSPGAFQVMAGNAFPYGTDKIVFIGGAPDSTFLKEQSLKNELALSTTNQTIEKSERIKATLLGYYNGHPGFSSGILVYNTLTKCITPAGTFPAFCPVTTHAIPYEKGAIIACGEIKPALRTPEIFNIQLFQ